MTATELLDVVDKHPEVWDLYANGFTQGLNQTEKQATTEKVKQFKPKNIVELAAFVASIRPGAKSLVNDFVSRTYHTYNIQAMDNLLRLDGATGKTGESAFLFYDEQVMTLAKSAGISPEDANVLTKAIKKKKLDKVKHFEEEFIPGFIKYLVETEHADVELAEKTAHDVWTVILNSASYLFNCAHAYCMAIDSLYGAVLKLLYPFEFYTTMLNIYTEKGNLEKIAAIISEMRAYRGIKLKLGRFGNDNRSWLIDKENNTISQSITGIKYCNENVAENLNAMIGLTNIYVIQDGAKWVKVYRREDVNAIEEIDGYVKITLRDGTVDSFWIIEKGFNKDVIVKYWERDYPGEPIPDFCTEHYQLELNSFSNILRYLQMATSLTTKHIDILIRMNYFEQFGSPNKLLDINAKFNDGEMKLSKTIKGWKKRLDALNVYEQMYVDNAANVIDICRAENEYVGISVTYDKRIQKCYMVTAVDDKYGIKVNLYNLKEGTSGSVKIAKKTWAEQQLQIGDVIVLNKAEKRQRRKMVDGESVGTGVFDVWLQAYSVRDAARKEDK